MTHCGSMRHDFLRFGMAAAALPTGWSLASADLTLANVDNKTL